jgi:hypothetical protein
MTDETGLVRPDRRLFSSGPRAMAAAMLGVVALVGAAGLVGSPANAAGSMPAGAAAVTPTGDPTDPPASPKPVAAITVGSVLHYRIVPVGYAATVIGTVDRPAGTAVTAKLARLRHNHWVTVQSQVIPASATAGRARATFPVSTTTTGHRTLRVEASSSSGAAATPGPEMSLTVVAARITSVHPAGDEYVTVKNAGTSAFDLRKWTLGTERLFITLPHRDLRPGQSVRVYTGPGTSTANRLYVSRAGNLWHKSGGTVLLTAPHHVLITSHTF